MGTRAVPARAGTGHAPRASTAGREPWPLTPGGSSVTRGHDGRQVPTSLPRQGARSQPRAQEPRWSERQSLRPALLVTQGCPTGRTPAGTPGPPPANHLPGHRHLCPGRRFPAGRALHASTQPRAHLHSSCASPRADRRGLPTPGAGKEEDQSARATLAGRAESPLTPAPAPRHRRQPDPIRA